MRKRLLTLLLPSLGMMAMAQNPIITGQFTADPTARVFEGKMYLYPSHDIPPVPHPGERPNWFCMADYHCFSSEDLLEWHDHGMILDQTQVPWGRKDAYSMWAPDCVQGKDGRYYFFYPDAPAEGEGFCVGVAIAEHPWGPFVPEKKPIEGVYGIDPCVLQASDGHNYIFWAEGGSLYEAPMTDNLLALADTGHVVVGLPEGFKEGPFAFERNGKCYLTYPWVRHEGGTECLAYATSNDPMGPWEYKGIIMKESPTDCWTNHHSIVEYRGQWYLFYHHNDYSPNFDKNRSTLVDSLYFDADGIICEVPRRPLGPSYKAGDYAVTYVNPQQPFEGWKVTIPAGGQVEYWGQRVPTEGDYSAWVKICPGSEGAGRTLIRKADETPLRVTVTPKAGGRGDIIVSNMSTESVNLVWVKLAKLMPVNP